MNRVGRPSSQGDKEWVCEFCSNSYSWQSGLNTHMRSKHITEMALRKSVDNQNITKVDPAYLYKMGKITTEEFIESVNKAIIPTLDIGKLLNLQGGRERYTPLMDILGTNLTTIAVNIKLMHILPVFTSAYRGQIYFDDNGNASYLDHGSIVTVRATPELYRNLYEQIGNAVTLVYLDKSKSLNYNKPDEKEDILSIMNGSLSGEFPSIADIMYLTRNIDGNKVRSAICGIFNTKLTTEQTTTTITVVKSPPVSPKIGINANRVIRRFIPREVEEIEEIEEAE